MQPIGKYILIHPVNEEMETQSGLLLTSDDVGEFRYRKANVVASGTEVQAIASGDTIYYDNRAGHSMMIKDIQYTVIRETDVVVVE
jgi:co-chaperonin GroES (HSP10)